MRIRTLLLITCSALAPLGATTIEAQVAIIGSAIHEREASPGESYEGTVMVENTTAAQQVVRVYQTDYHFHADGRSSFDAPGTAARSNATWVTLSSSEATILPGERARLKYRVAVPGPGTDSLRGTYWSVIMVEGAGQGSAGVGAPESDAMLTATVRHAIQVATHIVGTGSPLVEFSEPSIAVGPDSGRTLQVDLSNDGGRAHRLEIVLELFTDDGAPVATLRSSRGLLYPGSSLRQHFALGVLPAGTYRALVVADAGGDAVFGAQYTLRF